MGLQQTLSIVKPDAVARDLVGEIYRRFEQKGLRVVAARARRILNSVGLYCVRMRVCVCVRALRLVIVFM